MAAALEVKVQSAADTDEEVMLDEEEEFEGGVECDEAWGVDQAAQQAERLEAGYR